MGTMRDMPKLLVDILIDKFRKNHYALAIKQVNMIGQKHLDAMNYPPNFIPKAVRHNNFKYIYKDYTDNSIDKLHKSVISEAEEYLARGEKFKYDMDKIRNFMSCVDRNPHSKNLKKALLPQEILNLKPMDSVDSTNLLMSVDSAIGYRNLESTVNYMKKEYKEEIALIKRYYLISKLEE